MIEQQNHDSTIRRAANLAASVSLLAIAACSDSPTPPPEPIDPPGSPAWSQVGVNTRNSCALTEDRELYCWGFGVLGECDVGVGCGTFPELITVPASAMTFDTIASRGIYHCGITPAGEVWCWGEFDGGSLGDGTTRRSHVPVRVAVDAPVRMVTAGPFHACVLTDDGEAYCWGNSSGGKLGLGDYDPVFLPTPMQVVTDLRFESISAGSSQTCGIATDDRAYCWGGGYGTLGVGELDEGCVEGAPCLNTGEPMLVAGNHRWASIAAGNGFTCAVTLEHRGYCWGSVADLGGPALDYGVLGNGTFVGSRSPVPVSGSLEFRHIYAGHSSACGLTTLGAAYCWGSNFWGTLGNGTHGNPLLGGNQDQDRVPTPVQVAGGLLFSSLSLWEQVCGVSVNRNLYCWGDTIGGKLGNGEVGQGIRAMPTRVLSPEA